jgi:hypothetical protein
VFLAINWAVDSEIIDGYRTPNLYGLLFVTGLVLGYFVVKRMFKQEGIKEDVLDKLVAYMVIATIVGARLGHVLFYGPYFDRFENGFLVERGYFSHPESWCSRGYFDFTLHFFKKGSSKTIYLDFGSNFCSHCNWRYVHSTRQFSKS